MKVCYFGIYNKNYSTNRIIIKGLKKNGVEVVECNTRMMGIKKYIDLVKKHKKLRGSYDMMIVGFPGQQCMILARFLTRKKIIFNAFTSLYDQAVYDRKTESKYSYKALYYWFLDWLSCRLANKIILDTNEHIKYFVNTFKIRKEKFIRLFVGSDDEDVRPLNIERDRLQDKFVVYFHGTYIPLQGVEYIIEATKMIYEKDPDVHFTLFGTKIKNKYSGVSLGNTTFFDNVPYEEMKINMAKADICLGIFGDTKKAKRVIPNKVFEAMASKKTVITGRTDAALELLEDGINVIFCNMADPADLAEKILKIKDENDIVGSISDNAYNLFSNKLKPEVLMQGLLIKLKN